MARLLRSIPVVTWLVLGTMVALVGCETTPGGSNSDGDPDPDTSLPIGRRFATSLHATRAGKATWYAAENGGFESQVGIPISQLGCQGCHPDSNPGWAEASCMDCHAEEPGDAVEDATCLGCHSRQGVEQMMFPNDVHRAVGMGCMDCHTEEDVHGDGNTYATMFALGAIHVDCADCHQQGAAAEQGELQPPQIGPDHDSPHRGKLHCSACHVESVVTCYNCHFDSQVESHRKVFYKDTRTNPSGAPFTGWVFLINRNNKVYTASFQSAIYTGDDGAHDGFVAFGPMVGHTITREGRVCRDCHSNANVSQYFRSDDGVIDVARWSPDAGAIEHATGVIPIPPDYQDTLGFDFVDLNDDGSWSPVDVDTLSMQILEDAGSPLTSGQMLRLRLVIP